MKPIISGTVIATLVIIIAAIVVVGWAYGITQVLVWII